MRKTAALSIALAVGMTLAGSAQAEGTADTTQDGGMGYYGAAGTAGTTGSAYANGTSGMTGTTGNYDARTNSDLGTGIIGYHGRGILGGTSTAATVGDDNDMDWGWLGLLGLLGLAGFRGRNEKDNRTRI